MPNKYMYTLLSEAGLLIKNEIPAAKGAEDFFTTKDVKDLANELIKRMERREKCTILSTLVNPINNVTEFDASGTLHLYDNYLKPELIELSFEADAKKISIVVPDGYVEVGKEAEYLFKLRKKLLINPTNYLLGFMKMINSGELKLTNEKFLGLNIFALPENRNDLNKYPGKLENEDSNIYSVALQLYAKDGCGIYRGYYISNYPTHRIAFLCEDM